MSDLSHKRERLLALIRSFESCAVALSGGVDSGVVAKAAQTALGAKALAVTGRSASLAAAELDDARAIASAIGIRHEIVDTREFANDDYTRNAPDRCYHCKTELYTNLDAIREQFGVAVVANGANVDDRGDYRPGADAAREHAVRSPLAECEITKAEVRALAAEWGLSSWDKPASPCLSSRVAYGEEVTPQRLAMIESAETFLRTLGLRELRVRYHRGDLARIEVPAGAIGLICEPVIRDALVLRLRELGFKYIALDLEGFRSGNLNQVLPLATLELSAQPAR